MWFKVVLWQLYLWCIITTVPVLSVLVMYMASFPGSCVCPTHARAWEWGYNTIAAYIFFTSLGNWLVPSALARHSKRDHLQWNFIMTVNFLLILQMLKAHGRVLQRLSLIELPQFERVCAHCWYSSSNYAWFHNYVMCLHCTSRYYIVWYLSASFGVGLIPLIQLVQACYPYYMHMIRIDLSLLHCMCSSTEKIRPIKSAWEQVARVRACNSVNFKPVGIIELY